MRPTPGSRSFPAAILDAKLFLKERALGRRLLELGTKPTPAGGAATGIRQNETGQRDCVQNTRLDVLGHCLGKRTCQGVAMMGSG